MNMIFKSKGKSQNQKVESLNLKLKSENLKVESDNLTSRHLDTSTTRHLFSPLLTVFFLLITSMGWGQYTVNFEGAGETKTGYPSGNVTLSGIQWNMTEALIGTDAADFKIGLRSARMRGYSSSSMTMSANKSNGIGTISFKFWRYGTDGQATWKVEYSTNDGTSWSQAGSNFTPPTNNNEQTFSATVNVSGNVRIRIVNVSGANTSTNRRFNIDNIEISDYSAPTSYTVTFNANGGTGSMSNQTSSTAANLTTNSFTRAGYTFAGWNTAANGSGTSYSNEASYPFTSSTTLYAQWTANNLTVTFDSQGGSAISNGSTTTGGTVSDPGNPTQSGFNFIGWFTATSGGSALVFPYTHGQTSNFTLYAQWTSAAAPTLTAATVSGPLTSTFGTASTGVAFTAAGSNLTTTITATPQSGYEISSTLNGTYQSTAITGITNPSTLYVRFAANKNATDYNNDVAVVISGGGAASSANITTTSSGNTISKANQTITAIANTMSKTFGDATYSVATSSTSGLTISYSSSNSLVATVNASGIVTVVGAGTATITAAQSGNANYNAASSVTQALTVSKASQTISGLSATDSKTTSTCSYSLSATASSGLAVTYSSSNTSVATIAGSVVTIIGAGTTTITASQAGNANYDAASNVAQTLSVLTGPIYWDFQSASPCGVPTNLIVTDLTRSNNNGTTTLLTTGSASSGYTGASGNNNAGAAANIGTFSTAGSTYFQFTLTPASGYQVGITAISFGSRSTGTGPIAYTLRSSADNYASDIATGSMSANSAWALESNTGLSVMSATGTAITFRLYGFNGDGNPTVGQANWRIDDLALTYTLTQKQNPTINTQPTASAITYGQALSLSTLSGGVATVAGTFAFTTPATVPNGGTSNQSVTFTPTDQANYNNVTFNVSVTVNKANLTVTADPVSKDFGTTLSTPVTGSTAFTSSGLVNGDVISSVTISYESTFANSNAAIGTYTNAVTPSAALGISTDNYNITYASANGTVNPEPIFWSFGTVAPGNANAISGTPSNLTVSVLSQGNNNGTTPLLSTTSASSGYTGASANYNAGAAARTGALNTATSGSAYFEFTLTPAEGYQVDITSISFGSRSTGTGPQAYTLRSSADGYTGDIATGVLSSASIWQLKSNAGLTVSAAGSPITFRLYGHSGSGTASANTANWRIDDLKLYVDIFQVYSVTYNGNGNNLGAAPASTYHIPGSTVTVSSNSGALAKNTPVNYSFIGWNTNADGTGTFYAPGAGTFAINANTNLYARYAPQSIAQAPGSKIWIGNTGNWTDGSKWLPSGAPTTNSDNVYIDAGSPTMNTSFIVGSGKSFTLAGEASLTISPNVVLTITGTADFGDRPVILKSTSAGTASIGQISNDGANLTGATAVTVERYVQARRKWRALTTPLIGETNNSVFFNWQNNGANNGAGVMVWSPLATTGSGVYQTGAGTASSMLTYNSSTNNWSAVSNTNNSKLFDGSGNNPYMVFVTGPYNTTGNYVTSGVAATTLKATGTVRKGTITYNNVVASEKFYMFGNPYPSAINLKNAIRTGFTNFVYTWNPGLQSVGGYETRSLTANQTIESGQAFFLQDDATVVGNLLEFEESDKINVSSQTYFRTSEDPSYAQISIDLNKYVSGVVTKYDNATCDFMQGGNAGLDENDALKPTQFNENMSIYRAGKDLSWETRPIIAANDTLQLRMWAMKEANYQLKIDMSQFQLPAGSTAVLQDQFLAKETLLNLTGTTLVDFNVNASVASAGQRFRVVFRSSVVTPVTNLNGEKGLAIYPNPVAKGSDMQLEFRNKAAGKYTITVYNIAGVQVQQAVVRHNGGTAVQVVGLDQRLGIGNYLVDILNEKGEREQARLTIQ